MQILPIVAYGDPVLRQVAKPVPLNTDFQDLFKSMLATSKQADGAGLAAPQIGKSIRMFLIDTTVYTQLELGDGNEPQETAFINPEIIETSGDKVSLGEGCLSIPVRVNVKRDSEVTIKYYDQNWVHHERTYTGITARIILHEYDHLEGILHIDYASKLQKKLMAGKLKKISQGKIYTSYPMRFYNK